jgi:hypothetical protein
MTAAYFEDHPTDPEKVIFRKPSMKVEGPLHVVCQCDKCKEQQDQEPVACKECHLKDLVYDLLGELKVANLKLSIRAKRTWVGLTDEEVASFDVHAIVDAECVRAIEAKLKEKNDRTPCGHEETIVKGSLVHCKKCNYCFGVD